MMNARIDPLNPGTLYEQARSARAVTNGWLFKAQGTNIWPFDRLSMTSNARANTGEPE